MNPMGLLHHDSKEGEAQPHRRKRQRSENSSHTSNNDDAPPERGLRHSLSLARLRRPGHLQRTSSTVAQSEVANRIAREARFMDRLPLKAPYVPEEVCSGCGKAECECEPESDDEEEQEEVPKNWCQKILHNIRLKTDVVRDYSGRIVNDQGFQIFIVILILINSLFIGLSTFDFVESNPNAYRAFRILDVAFLIIFTIELIMQFLYHGYGLFFDGWLLFDLFIVFTSWTLESISVLRTLRLRSFRIFRAFRLTTRIRALRRLVEAIFDVLPRITAIICMFCLIIYIFGVMCTELFGTIDFTDRFTGDEQAGTYSYFSRLDDSLFTLFHMVTLDWARVTRAVMQVYPWAWAIFSTFVTFSSFVLYNLIIAVVCDAVKMVQDQQDILMVENYVKDKIESRHRIINLRQKLDKMSKQQMDLLLYVQLMLEQVEDVGEASKQHYEEALLQLSQTNTNARDALKRAILQLDQFEKLAGIDELTRSARRPRDELNRNNNVETVSIKPVDPPQFPRSNERIPRSRRVSFKEMGAVGRPQLETVAVFADIKQATHDPDVPLEDAREQAAASRLDLSSDGEGMENESFRSCRLMPPEEEPADSLSTPS